MNTPRKTLPAQGQDWATLQARMDAMRRDDVDWKNGRAAVYVFYAGDDVLQVAQEAYTMFMSENGLGMARAFPSLQQMEADVSERSRGRRGTRTTRAARSGQGRCTLRLR